MHNLIKMIGNIPNEANFKKRMRLHQGWWRAFVLGENQGRHPVKNEEKICSTLLNGVKTKNNLLSPIVENVIREVIKKRKGNNAGLINIDRLYNNLLSSQPLCFNFFAPMYNDKKLALDFLKKNYPEITLVNEVYFEFANSNNKFDNSAFDVAFEVMIGSKKGIIGFECKYTDTFSSTRYNKESYETIYENSVIWDRSYEDLTCPRYNQLFRNQLIGESFKQSKQYDFAYLALFCHQEDEDAITIAREYKLMFDSKESHNFKVITYEDYFEQIMKLNLTWEMREYFMLLWARYCGLDLSKSAYNQLENQVNAYHQVYDVDENELENKIVVLQAEGGKIYTAEKGGELYVVSDFSSIIGFLNEEDLEDGDTHISIYRFANELERESYLSKYNSKMRNINS